MKILLQFPEGLKKEAAKYAERYEREGHEVLLSASPCYGACDLALEEAKAIGAQKLVHFGHAPFGRAPFGKAKPPLDVEYVEFHVDGDLEKFGKAAALIKEKRVSLVTTVQHIHQLAEMKKMLGALGKEVFIGGGVRAHYPGQVLGCDALAAGGPSDSDAIVYFGGGMFHPLAIDGGAAGGTDRRPVYAIHPESGALTDLTPEIGRRRKRRMGAIAAALAAKTFGIIVSTKSGQFGIESAEWAKSELERRGKRAMLLIGGEISALCLNNFMLFECYITTACPRLSDDGESFGKPVLDLGMLRQMLAMTDKKE